MTKRRTTRWAVAAAAVWMAASIVCPARGQATEQDARRALNEAARLPPAEACGRIEDLLGQPLSGRDRRACLQRLRHLLPEAPTPLNAKENQLVTEARESNDRITQMLVGRHVIVLGTDRFTRRARDNNLVTQLDLSCAALKALFGNDPVRRAGHRYIIYPRRGKRSGYTTNSPTLRVWIGQAQQDDADRIEALVHELSHPFIHDHPARHIFAGGFTEGWADFAKAYVSDQLGFLGPPFRGRFAWWASDFRKAGRVEYLDTRLPIEEIIAYRPSSSLLVELVLAGSVSGGPGRWEPYRRLFHDAVEHPPPTLPGRYWPAHMAYDYRRYFDEDKVLPILRRYRFPVDRASQQEVQRLLAGEVAGDQEEAARVMTGWKVLGPLPDADGVKLRLDPIDAENFTFRDVYQVEGRAYRWQEVPVDGAGVVRLGDLPGARAACVFYLFGRWPADWPPARTLLISSDDSVVVWVDGVRVHTFAGNRGVRVNNPDAVYARLQPGSTIVAKVVNDGGAAGFHLRATTEDPFSTRYRAECADPDPRRREAMVRYLGTRRTAAESRIGLLIEALRDPEPRVRAAAAWALGGCRNAPYVVAALIDGWDHEANRAAARAMRLALAELTFESFAGPGPARRWWQKARDGFAQSFFVECETARALGASRGGFYGHNEGAYGGQCIDRGWGNRRQDVLELLLEAVRPGDRTIFLRYTCPREGGGLLAIRGRRGDGVVFEPDSVPLARTISSAHWRWVEVPIGTVDAGRYRVEIQSLNGPVDCDVLGWR